MIRTRRVGSIRRAPVLKVDSQGKIKLAGQHLADQRGAGGRVGASSNLEERVLVYYCRTLVRELDLGIQDRRSSIAWMPS